MRILALTAGAARMYRGSCLRDNSLAPEHRGYLHGVERLMKDAGLAHEFHDRGELDRERKIEFLRSLSVQAIPTTHAHA